MFDPYDDNITVPDPVVNRVKRVLTSATLFIAAYIPVFLLQQFITGGLCLIFGYNPKITYNDIGNLPFEYTSWSFLRVLIIFSSGPVICLLIGIFLIDFFNQLRGKRSLFRFFILWMATCCLNLFLGFILFSPLGIEQYHSGLYVGFSIVGTWTRMGFIVTSPLALASAAASMLVGYFLFSNIIKFSFSSRLLQTPSGQRKIIVQFFIMPVLLAAPLLIALTTFKSVLLHVALLFNMLLMGMGLFINVGSISRDITVQKNDVLNDFPVTWLLLAASIYLSVWFFLRDDDLLIISRKLF